MKLHTIKSEIYPATIHIAIGKCTEKELNYALTRRIKEPINLDFPAVEANARCWSRGGHHIVWMPEFNIPSAVHEFCHVTFFVARHVDIIYSEDSEEFYCYFNQWLMKEFLKIK